MPRFDVLLRKAGLFWAATACAVAVSCARPPETTLSRQAEARRLAGRLLLGFSKSVDAGNRAVMADTDELSQSFAREAEQASTGVEHDAQKLAVILRELGYGKEGTQLEQALGKLGEYLKLEHEILGLAVENTNLKAQRLSFGPGSEAANAFAGALQPVPDGVRAADAWHARALVASAVASVREIEALQARHIAESEDQAMTQMEQAMASAAAKARSALEELSALAVPADGPRLETAKAALERFAWANAQIVTLSRRNTNVRSLAMALGQKRVLAAACEDALRALEASVASHGFSGTR